MPIKHSISIRTPLFLFDPDDAGAKTPEQLESEKKAAQEALNAQFAERASRASETARKELLAELGVSDPEEAKKLLKSAKEADDAKKSEQEKLQAQINEVTQKAEKATAEADKIKQDSLKRVQDSEIKIAASAPVMDKDGKTVTRPAFRPEALADVLVLLNREGITEKDGSFEGIDKALAELAKAKPYLLAEKAEAKPKNGNPQGPQGKKQASGDGERKPIIGSL